MSVCGPLGFYNTSGTRTHVRFGFGTFAAAGANVAPNSAFEAADLRIYKATDGAALSATQRSSANGITMTSPFDSLTGVHTVDIDLTDNTDAGFYASGCYYEVWLCPDETVDSQTITGICLCSFEIGVAKADVTQFGGTAGTFSGGRPEVNTSHAAGTAWNSGAIGASTLASDTIAAAKIATGAITSAKFAAGAIDAAAIATDAIDSDAIAASAVTEIQSGLATAAALDAVDNFIDTEIADIQSRLPAALTAGGNIKADALAWNGLTTVALPLAPTVAGRSLDVTAGGNAGIDWANVSGQTTLVDLSATTVGAVSAVNGSVAVGSIAAGAITAAVIADGAIDAATFAADALAAFQQEATDALNAYAPATPAQVNAEVLDVLNVDTLIDGKTFVQAVQYVSAITAGRVSGAGTGTEVFKGLDEATTRVTVTVDGSGNRTDIVYG